MSDSVNARPEGPGRRRESWSLRSLVEEVSGRPLNDFQDPDRPTHPYVEFHRHRLAQEAAVAKPAAPVTDLEESDPVERVYPPLSGETGRALHGPEHEHHAPTLEALGGPSEPPAPGHRTHGPGPSRRPERVYLHYLLLHLDRLSDSALDYLQTAVEEELRHRTPPSSPT